MLRIDFFILFYLFFFLKPRTSICSWDLAIHDTKAFLSLPVDVNLFVLEHYML